jgi:hypothetical protein
MIPEIEGEGGTLPARSQSRFGNAETRIGPKKINSRNDRWEQRLSWLVARSSRLHLHTLGFASRDGRMRPSLHNVA